MKKIVLLTSIFCLSVVTHAQSTCETRVDAHQKASTSQRVEYCLHSQNDPSSLHNPGLVFSGVSSPDLTEPEREQTRPTAHNHAFKSERIEVSESFVPTRTFPKVTDGRVSEQEKMAKRQALQEGRQAALETLAQNQCELPEEIFEEKEVLEPKQTSASAQAIESKDSLVQSVAGIERPVTEAPTGVRARTHKPGRQLIKENDAVAPAAGSTQEPVLQESEFEEGLSATADVATPAPYDPYMPQEIPVGTVSYSPATSQEIPVGTASYAPAQ